MLPYALKSSSNSDNADRLAVWRRRFHFNRPIIDLIVPRLCVDGDSDIYFYILCILCVTTAFGATETSNFESGL